MCAYFFPFHPREQVFPNVNKSFFLLLCAELHCCRNLLFFLLELSENIHRFAHFLTLNVKQKPTKWLRNACWVQQNFAGWKNLRCKNIENFTSFKVGKLLLITVNWFDDILSNYTTQAIDIKLCKQQKKGVCFVWMFGLGGEICGWRNFAIRILCRHSKDQIDKDFCSLRW